MVGLVVGVECAGRHAPEFLDHDFCILHRFPLDRAGHHRGGSLAYRAAMSFESDGSNLVILHVYRKLDVVSAQRFVSVRMVVRVRNRTPVSRFAVVVEDYFLIKLSYIAHANISCTFRMPLTSLSISSLVL